MRIFLISSLVLTHPVFFIVISKYFEHEFLINVNKYDQNEDDSSVGRSSRSGSNLFKNDTNYDHHKEEEDYLLKESLLLSSSKNQDKNINNNNHQFSSHIPINNNNHSKNHQKQNQNHTNNQRSDSPQMIDSEDVDSSLEDLVGNDYLISPQENIHHKNYDQSNDEESLILNEQRRSSINKLFQISNSSSNNSFSDDDEIDDDKQEEEERISINTIHRSLNGVFDETNLNNDEKEEDIFTLI